MDFDINYNKDNVLISGRESYATPKNETKQLSRPTPIFHEKKFLTFSTKKERGTPKCRAPPRPPIKSCPPISRIFHRISIRSPLLISCNKDDCFLNSVHYSDSNTDSYFHQCFDILELLGSGSFGDVYKVRSKDNGKLYAVKKSRERFRGGVDRELKLEEVYKHERLPRHPNCVTFVKAWEENLHLYIQTELCRSNLCSLGEANHSISEQLIRNYTVDLLMAVKHLHDHQLVHMDLKPENIFISDDDLCKIGDFGLVIDLLKQPKVTEAQEGDPKYMAPELMNGIFDKPADIFSLGITLLELGGDIDLPASGKLWHDLRSASLPDDLMSHLSCEMKSLIKEMLNPCPRSRKTVEELLNLEFIEKTYRKRRRKQCFKRLMKCSYEKYSHLKQIVYSWFTFLTLPIYFWLPSKFLFFFQDNSTPISSTPKQNKLDFDCSFSDGEESGVHPMNTSLGKPLDMSSSSEESNMSAYERFILPFSPTQKAMTTPSYRFRKSKISTPLPLISPKMNGFRSRLSSSNSSASLNKNEHEDVFGSPTNDRHEQSMNRSVTIEPKNLLHVFEGALSDEEL